MDMLEPKVGVRGSGSCGLADRSNHRPSATNPAVRISTKTKPHAFHHAHAAGPCDIGLAPDDLTAMDNTGRIIDAAMAGKSAPVIEPNTAERPRLGKLRRGREG